MDTGIATFPEGKNPPKPHFLHKTTTPPTFPSELSALSRASRSLSRCCCLLLPQVIHDPPVPVLLMSPTYSSPSHPLLPSLLRQNKNPFRNCKIHSPRSDREAPHHGIHQCLDSLRIFHGERKPAPTRQGLGRRTKPPGRRLRLDGSNRISPPTRYLKSESCRLFLARRETEARNKSPRKVSGVGRGLGPGRQPRAGEAAVHVCCSCCRIYCRIYFYDWFFFLPSLTVSPSHA